MNQSTLRCHPWPILLIILFVIFFTIVVIQLYQVSEPFVTYPAMPTLTSLSTPVTSDPAIAKANEEYASLLRYLQQHPSQSVRFISDLKQKFFADSCTVKDNIDFKNLAQLNGSIF
jgi:hypothetical protein